jgi:hypothetical protein
MSIREINFSRACGINFSRGTCGNGIDDRNDVLNGSSYVKKYYFIKIHHVMN